MTEASGRNTVPQIFINGTHVGGSDELFELDVRGELDKLLGRTPPPSEGCGLGADSPQAPCRLMNTKGESVGLSYLE
jgi:hypothetical protein